MGFQGVCAAEVRQAVSKAALSCRVRMGAACSWPWLRVGSREVRLVALCDRLLNTLTIRLLSVVIPPYPGCLRGKRSFPLSLCMLGTVATESGSA